MAQDKTQLQQLLLFIDELAKPENGNGWFVDELRKRFGSESAVTDIKKEEDQEMIKQYLCLEFLDKSLPETEKYAWVRKTIYDFVDNDYIRETLYADWYEMIRHRFGTRMHKQSFEESCRYAAIQMERLLNYYYLKKGGPEEGAVKMVADAPNLKVDPSKVKRIERVTWAMKLFSFNLYMKKERENFNDKVYKKIAYVRNDASHGAIESINQKINNFENKIPGIKDLAEATLPSDINKIKDSTVRAKIEESMSDLNEKYETFRKKVIEYNNLKETSSFYENGNFDNIIIPLIELIKLVERKLNEA